MRRWPSLALTLPLCACGPRDPIRHGPDTGPPAPDDSATDDTGAPPVDGCRSQPQAADRDRLVLVSYPYDAAGGSATAWQVFTLGTAGDLETAGTRIELGRGYDGRVAFTPDGSIGLAVHDDGSLGVIEALSAREARVVHARFEGDFYASAVAADPSGEWAWIVDGNWAENGGGLYRAAIDCEDGHLGTPERVLEARLPSDLLFLRGDPTRAVLVGRRAGGATGGEDAFLVSPGSPTAVLSGADLFGDDEAIFAGAAVTADDAWVLVGDNSAFSGIPNRVAVAAVVDGGPTPTQVLEVDDPVDVIASPLGDLALVVSGYSDAVFVLEPGAGQAEPFRLAGEPAYVGASPQLPAAADVVTRGSLRGTVVLTENQGLRRMRFEQDRVVDLGLSAFGDGLEWIPGAVGIQP